MTFMKNGFFIGILAVFFFAMGVGIVSAGASLEQDPFTEFRLTADDPSGEKEFGRSVAIDGDLLAVGAGGDGYIGTVYLYKRHGMGYVHEAELDFPDPIPEMCPQPGIIGNCSEFGRTVAIQGNTVFVGARFAPVDTSTGTLNAGAVYVFRKHGDFWQYEDKIVSPVPEEGDNFGRALAVQGNLLIVTARKTVNEEGAAFVYLYKGGMWVHMTNLVASDPTKNAYFGQSVDIQGDVIAIGARNTGPEKEGGFYIFRKSGDEWMEIAKVTSPDADSDAPDDEGKIVIDNQYGFTIAIEGDMIAVGARRANPDHLEDAGAVYVYSVKEDSVELITKLTASDASAFDEFGQSVAFGGDVLAVGAWKDDNKQGSIYLFSRKGDQWVETNKITASDGRKSDEFGYSLAAFGNRIVTGAHKARSGVGAAYVFPLKQ